MFSCIFQTEMLEFRDVFIMCMLFVHVSRGYVDLPAELPPHMGPPPSGNNDSLLH